MHIPRAVVLRVPLRRAPRSSRGLLISGSRHCPSGAPPLAAGGPRPSDMVRSHGSSPGASSLRYSASAALVAARIAAASLACFIMFSVSSSESSWPWALASVVMTATSARVLMDAALILSLSAALAASPSRTNSIPRTRTACARASRSSIPALASANSFRHTPFSVLSMSLTLKAHASSRMTGSDSSSRSAATAACSRSIFWSSSLATGGDAGSRPSSPTGAGRALLRLTASTSFMACWPRRAALSPAPASARFCRLTLALFWTRAQWPSTDTKGAFRKPMYSSASSRMVNPMAVRKTPPKAP
mmetsp:Transcript_6429/g.13474  ORF Transcript_6429/g.13474 Transcript_6429/m.13474 type:complete len:303 (+) Transcript_6429:76-984(+)